jgi:hypothetical protein
MYSYWSRRRLLWAEIKHFFISLYFLIFSSDQPGNIIARRRIMVVVLCVTTECSFVGGSRLFGGTCCHHLQGRDVCVKLKSRYDSRPSWCRALSETHDQSLVYIKIVTVFVVTGHRLWQEDGSVNCQKLPSALHINDNYNFTCVRESWGI